MRIEVHLDHKQATIIATSRDLHSTVLQYRSPTQLDIENGSIALTLLPEGILTMNADEALAEATQTTGQWKEALEQGYNNTSPKFWRNYQVDLFLGGEGGILGALKRTNTSAVILPTTISPGIPALVGSPVVSVPMGFYPWNTTIAMNGRGDLVATGPNVPYGLVSGASDAFRQPLTPIRHSWERNGVRPT